MDADEARTFLRANPRTVLATRKKDGGPQLSPVVAVPGDDGRLMISSRETAYKVRNIRRDPRVSLCVLNDGFFGQWMLIDGTAELVSLPTAMDLLVDYYRRLSGEHPDWEDYRAAMQRDRRVMVLVTIERVGPDRQG
jgi:PPOX class probable F420-dependent enzyme